MSNMQQKVNELEIKVNGQQWIIKIMLIMMCIVTFTLISTDIKLRKANELLSQFIEIQVKIDESIIENDSQIHMKNN
ncbi:hypothetical protein [Vallitalea guaymasensis]|uniref:hypothetical protein n=1 Tax=Vallitalea guaymasensis TaxID=1185412 RepID=UPI002355B20D|nr:hypothetical protein [Vallitalea guaymasensis]